MTEHPWSTEIPSPAAGRLFSASVYKIRDLLTMFAPMGTCARAARPCTRSPINAVRRGEGPFRRRRPSPRDPAEIFYSRRFLRADISSIDRPQRGCRHGPGRKRPTLRPRGPPARENHHHRSPLHTSSRDLFDHSRSHKREIEVWFLDACFSKWNFNERFLQQGLSLAVEFGKSKDSRL